MIHFAKVENGFVVQVIVAEQDFIDTGAVGDPSSWVQTSYNTLGGVHRTGGTPMRKNYAGIGMVYDSVRDAFYSSQPYPSWILDENTCYWVPPVALPEDHGTGEPPKMYEWDETITNWKEVTVSV